MPGQRQGQADCDRVTADSGWQQVVGKVEAACEEVADCPRCGLYGTRFSPA